MPISEIVVLTAVGLSVGVGFLVFLLIGDRRESKRKAMEEARRQMFEEASVEHEGVWPPPIKRETL